MEEIEETIRIGGADSAYLDARLRFSNSHPAIERWWDYRSLFHSRADRYRGFTVIMMGFFGQSAGNNLITYFLPILLGAAGITSQDRKLTLNFVNSITSFLGALTVSF
jgi:hypothetical protein